MFSQLRAATSATTLWGRTRRLLFNAPLRDVAEAVASGAPFAAAGEPSDVIVEEGPGPDAVNFASFPINAHHAAARAAATYTLKVMAATGTATVRSDGKPAVGWTNVPARVTCVQCAAEVNPFAHECSRDALSAVVWDPANDISAFCFECGFVVRAPGHLNGDSPRCVPTRAVLPTAPHAQTGDAVYSVLIHAVADVYPFAARARGPWVDSARAQSTRQAWLLKDGAIRDYFGPDRVELGREVTVAEFNDRLYDEAELRLLVLTALIRRVPFDYKLPARYVPIPDCGLPCDLPDETPATFNDAIAAVHSQVGTQGYCWLRLAATAAHVPLWAAAVAEPFPSLATIIGAHVRIFGSPPPRVVRGRFLADIGRAHIDPNADEYLVLYGDGANVPVDAVIGDGGGTALVVDGTSTLFLLRVPMSAAATGYVSLRALPGLASLVTEWRSVCFSHLEATCVAGDVGSVLVVGISAFPLAATSAALTAADVTGADAFVALDSAGANGSASRSLACPPGVDPELSAYHVGTAPAPILHLSFTPASDSVATLTLAFRVSGGGVKRGTATSALGF
jgi:hypothetical protein